MEELLLMGHLKGKSANYEEMIEKAFKEGCEHGYHKAMKELERYNEVHEKETSKESFEERMKRLKEKYK